jgi:hypothetical protein
VEVEALWLEMKKKKHISLEELGTNKCELKKL